MRHLISPLLALLFLGALAAADTPALSAEVLGFNGTLVGTKVSYSKSKLTMKVSDVIPGRGNKAPDATKLKGTEVEVFISFEAKTPDGKWGANKEQASAASGIENGAKIVVSVKTNVDKGTFVMNAMPRIENYTAVPKAEEAKTETEKAKTEEAKTTATTKE